MNVKIYFTVDVVCTVVMEIVFLFSNVCHRLNLVT